MAIADTTPEGISMVAFYDATNPEARAFVWERVKKNYLDYGVRVFWLDADEPELMPMHAENIRYAPGHRAGSDATSTRCCTRRAFMTACAPPGRSEIINLSRSAWAGTQRYGAAVWSGDIRSRFEVLRAQIPAGLNIAMSGIPWWTTDIGGFMEGDIRTDYFKELIVRWFQYGVFCPLFRLHGVRQPLNGLYGAQSSGADNEVWSFGEQGLRDHPRPALPAREAQALPARAQPGRARARHAAHAPALLRLPRRPSRRQPGRPVHARAGPAGRPGDRAGRSRARRSTCRRARIGWMPGVG